MVMVDINTIHNLKLTEDTAPGQRGVSVAKPAQPVTKSEGDTVTIHGLQMAGKTARNWGHHVKHLCVNRCLLVMVSFVLRCSS